MNHQDTKAQRKAGAEEAIRGMQTVRLHVSSFVHLSWCLCALVV